jgi:hypothetical protein
MLSDEELLFKYGKDAVVSRKGLFVLVHLDHPSPELLRFRTDEFDPDRFFCVDCELCQMLKESGIVVFDDSLFEDEEPLWE